MTTTPMKSQLPTPAHIACRDDVLAAVQRHSESLSAVEILALLSYTVGQTIALQDQRSVTPRQALDLVMKNIEAGNADAIEHSLGQTKGNA